MKISEIKDHKVRALAMKRYNEDPNVYGAPTYLDFDWKATPEGYEFWLDVINRLDVQHYNCYPGNNPPFCETVKNYKAIPIPTEMYKRLIKNAEDLEKGGEFSAAWGVLMVLSNEIRKGNVNDN